MKEIENAQRFNRPTQKHREIHLSDPKATKCFIWTMATKTRTKHGTLIFTMREWMDFIISYTFSDGASSTFDSDRSLFFIPAQTPFLLQSVEFLGILFYYLYATH